MDTLADLEREVQALVDRSREPYRPVPMAAEDEPHPVGAGGWGRRCTRCGMLYTFVTLPSGTRTERHIRHAS